MKDHGVGSVVIDKDNVFHYICKCGADRPSLETAREHGQAMAWEALWRGEIVMIPTDRGVMRLMKS